MLMWNLPANSILYGVKINKNFKNNKNNYDWVQHRALLEMNIKELLKEKLLLKGESFI